MTDVVDGLIGEIGQMLNEYEAQKKALLEKLRPQFQAIFTPFFEAKPKGAITFLAYTPYFNDGEPCEYSVHELAFHSGASVAEREDDDEDDDDEEFSMWEGDIHTWDHRKPTDPEELAVFNICQDCQRTFSRIPEDMIKDLFGDHIGVTIRRGSVVVSEYDHE